MSTIEAHEPVSQTPDDEATGSFADKTFGDLLGTLSTFATSIGVELGWHQAQIN